ncbi:MAG TPA: DUF1673 family protein [Candidatus Methanoperedens sp.]
MTIGVTEVVRKTMGWCPNANAFETRNKVQFDNPVISIPGGGAMKRMAEEPDIKNALVVVGVYAVLGALSTYMQSYRVTFVFEGFGDIPRLSNTEMAAFSFIGIFILWFIGTGIIHQASKFLGGKGKFYPDMMTIAGYSFLPMILASLISLGLLFMVEPMTITLSPANPAAGKEIYDNPYIFGSSTIAAVLQILASAILFFGVQRVQKLTPARSAIVAGIPLVFFLASLGGLRYDLVIIPILVLVLIIGYLIFINKYIKAGQIN